MLAFKRQSVEPLRGFSVFYLLWLLSQEEGTVTFSSLKLRCMLGLLHNKPYFLCYKQYRTRMYVFEIWILLPVVWYLFEFLEADDVGSL